MTVSRPIAVLAEDDELTRKLTADLLDGFGFDVREADRAATALNHFASTEDVALLHTDLNMPGEIDGFDLVDRVVERWPGTRIIVCSACPREAAKRLPDRAHFVAKPFTVARMHRALEALSLR